MMYNRTLAALVTAIVMIFSVIFGGVHSVNRLYNKVEDIFVSGESGDGVSVSKDITKNREDAKNLITIGAKYLPSDDLNLDLLNQATAQESKDLTYLFSQNTDISAAAKGVYDALGTRSLSETDEKYRQKLFANIESRNRTMANDAYNKTANDFNQAVSHFPASAWARLSGKNHAPMFR